MEFVKSSSECLAASTALAGLVLVFLGNILSGFDRYGTIDKPAVVASYRKRGWFAFGSFMVCLASSLASLAGMEMASPSLAAVGASLLVVSLGLVTVLGFLTVREIA